MRTRTLIALLITLGSIGVSLFVILRGGVGQSPEAAIAAGSEPSAALRFPASLPTVIPGNGTAAAALQFDPTNMSDLLANSFLQNIEGKNPEGPTDGTIKLPNENTVADLIAEGATESISFKNFTERDIRVGKDDLRETQVAYLDALDRLTRQHFNSIGKTVFDAVDEFNRTGRATLFERFAATIPGYLADILALPVPPSLKEAHLAWLNLWQKKRAVYETITKAGDDPLKAYVGLQQITEIVNEDVRLQSNLIDAYQRLTRA